MDALTDIRHGLLAANGKEKRLARCSLNVYACRNSLSLSASTSRPPGEKRTFYSRQKQRTMERARSNSLSASNIKCLGSRDMFATYHSPGRQAWQTQELSFVQPSRARAREIMNLVLRDIPALLPRLRRLYYNALLRFTTRVKPFPTETLLNFGGI